MVKAHRHKHHQESIIWNEIGQNHCNRYENFAKISPSGGLIPWETETKQLVNYVSNIHTEDSRELDWAKVKKKQIGRKLVSYITVNGW